MGSYGTPFWAAAVIGSLALGLVAKAGEDPGPVCDPPLAPVSMAGATVLGDGTPVSVSQAEIQAALDAGGPILFDVGPSPVTIPLTSELVVSRAATLDGAGVVTLSGQGSHRVILITNPQNLTYTLTLQNLGIEDGATPAGSGAGVYKPSGGPWQAVSLHVIDSWFRDNVAIVLAQDDGGGAIYATGMDEVVIYRSIFEGNRGSNGGALYSLGSRTVTVVESDFLSNVATGMGANPGNGGNAGALGVDGAERTVRLCNVRLIDNRANAFGAGFFSVMYDAASLTSFNGCTFDSNLNPLDTAFAAGAYVQGGPFSIRNTSFLYNSARGNAALFVGPGASGEIVNSTFYGNEARTSLGGAMGIDSTAVVSIVNTTIAENTALDPSSFAAGIANSNPNNITMKNSVLAHNVGGNVFNPWNIRFPVGDGGGNLQFPQTRPNGQPEPAATPTVIWADPLVEAPDWNLGPTRTAALGAGSPAVGAGVGAGAPARDQRGVLRDAAVDAGAYESAPELVFFDSFESGGFAAWSATVGSP